MLFYIEGCDYCVTQIVFGDSEGYVGIFEDVYPVNTVTSGGVAVNDTLADDSLLMEVLYCTIHSYCDTVYVLYFFHRIMRKKSFFNR